VRGEVGARRVELAWVTFWTEGSLEVAWNSTGLSIVMNSLGCEMIKTKQTIIEVLRAWDASFFRDLFDD
jgi:hypothetical protein